MSTNTVPNLKRYRGGLISAGALGVTFLLWQVPALSTVVYPFRLFVTLVHELGHGAVAVLTGGHFLSLQVMSNGAGLAFTAGGSPLMITQAGYLGATAFGALMLILANKLHDPRPLTAAVGMICGGATVLLGVDLTTKLIGLAVFGVFVALMWKGPVWLNAFALNLLAMMVGLNALMDVWWLVGSVDLYLGNTPNDALAMQQMTSIPAVVWAFFWVVISVAVLAWSVYITFIRPMRRREAAK